MEPKEQVGKPKTNRESDQSIALQDGRAVHKGKGLTAGAYKGNLGRTCRAGQPRPTSLWGIAKTRSRAFAEAKLSEEPVARKPHAGLCAGGGRETASLPRWQEWRLELSSFGIVQLF